MVEDEVAAKILASSANATDGSSDKEEPEVLNAGTSIDEPLSASASLDALHGRQPNPSTTDDSRPAAQMKPRSCCILL